jgi:hypothetical protein
MLKFWNLVTTKWSKFVHLEIDEIIVNSIKQSTQLWGKEGQRERTQVQVKSAQTQR